MWRWCMAGILLLLTWGLQAETGDSSTDGMDDGRLAELVKRLDPEATGQSGYWEMRLEQRPVYVITDTRANRMRVMTPVDKSDALGEERLLRLLQANFDTALDARYAIAKGHVWATFIHPLLELEESEFISGVAQTVTLAISYGSSYNSGALTFGGGDSKGIYEREVFERIIERGRAI